MDDSDGMAERVIADQQQLGQAIGHFLSNADTDQHEANDALVVELLKWKRQEQQ